MKSLTFFVFFLSLLFATGHAKAQQTNGQEPKKAKKDCELMFEQFQMGSPKEKIHAEWVYTFTANGKAELKELLKDLKKENLTLKKIEARDGKQVLEVIEFTTYAQNGFCKRMTEIKSTAKKHPKTFLVSVNASGVKENAEVAE